MLVLTEELTEGSAESDGLLQHSSPTEYASRIDNFAAAAALLMTPGFFQRAAALDVGDVVGGSTEACFKHVHAALQSFVAGKDLCDREGTMSELTRLMHDKGQFVELVGARNLGKSHMLATLASDLNADGGHVAIIVDTRLTGSNLAAGIGASLATFGPDFAAGVLANLGRVAAATVDQLLPGSGDALRSVGVGAAPACASAAELVLAFILHCHRTHKYPVILIDEAVLALSATDIVSSQTAERDLFALFTLVTKQQLRANVIFAASGFAESGRFKALHVSCDDTFSKVVVASEVPPAPMLRLLISCGCGTALAAAFVAVYGGSVWAVFKALGSLSASTESAATFKAVFALAPAATFACFEDAGSALAEPMAQMLHAVVQDGFAALDDPSDKCAAILRSHGVGGVVSLQEHFAGAQVASWAGGQRHTHIVVPSSQTMRLLLCLNARVCGASHHRSKALDALLDAAVGRDDPAPWWVEHAAAASRAAPPPRCLRGVPRVVPSAAQ